MWNFHTHFREIHIAGLYIIFRLCKGIYFMHGNRLLFNLDHSFSSLTILLADRTNGRAIATLLRLSSSVRPSVRL